MSNCLFCYEPLAANEQDVHASCLKKIFGQPTPPVLPYSEEGLEPLAKEVIQNQTAVTGVQAKLSLHITGNAKAGNERRFTIVGLWVVCILKPPTDQFAQLPEVEDATMHLAQLARIRTAPHSLIRLQSGNLAYITRRMDRTKKGKLAMEDMCQLTERLTEDKYRGSYEQIGKAIQRHSVNPGLDVALTLNGRKKKLNKQDFVAAMNALNVAGKQQENIFNKLANALPKWKALIDRSFLSNSFKAQYKNILTERMDRLR